MQAGCEASSHPLQGSLTSQTPTASSPCFVTIIDVRGLMIILASLTVCKSSSSSGVAAGFLPCGNLSFSAPCVRSINVASIKSQKIYYRRATPRGPPGSSFCLLKCSRLFLSPYISHVKYFKTCTGQQKLRAD